MLKHKPMMHQFKHSNSVTQQKPIANKKPEKPVRNKSPNKPPENVISDRLPKGSDDSIKQHNRFIRLDEDMKADDDHADGNANKQGRIIKIINKKLIYRYFQFFVVSSLF